MRAMGSGIGRRLCSAGQRRHSVASEMAAKLETAERNGRASAGARQILIENGGIEQGLKIRSVRERLCHLRRRPGHLHRLHGNPQWRSIGKAVSSGCVRLLAGTLSTSMNGCRSRRQLSSSSKRKDYDRLSLIEERHVLQAISKPQLIQAQNS